MPEPANLNCSDCSWSCPGRSREVDAATKGPAKGLHHGPPGAMLHKDNKATHRSTTLQRHHHGQLLPEGGNSIENRLNFPPAPEGKQKLHAKQDRPKPLERAYVGRIVRVPSLSSSQMRAASPDSTRVGPGASKGCEAPRSSVPHNNNARFSGTRLSQLRRVQGLLRCETESQESL